MKNQGKRFLAIESPAARCFAYAALIFGIWLLIWIVPHYPGTLRDDTISVLFESLGIAQLTTHHPVFDTIVFKFFWDVGDMIGNKSAGMFLFILCNSALLAFSLAASFVYGEEHAVPRWLIVLLLLGVSFGRIFYQPADAMSKDSLNTWMFVLCCLMFAEAVRTKGNLFRKKPYLVANVILLFLCMISKRTMLIAFPLAYVVLLCVMLIRAYRKPCIQLTSGRSIQAKFCPM